MAVRELTNVRIVLASGDLETCEILCRQMARLTPRERCLLTLYYFDGVTMKQIGAALGASESRVWRLHSRAIASLRSQLAELSKGAIPERDGIAIGLDPGFETRSLSRTSVP